MAVAVPTPRARTTTRPRIVPDGAPDTECYFVVRELVPYRYLVLHSRSHLPPGFRDRFEAWLDWSWVFVLSDEAGDRTRFMFRTRARLGPWWLALVYRLALIPADFVMSRQMLRGVRDRAERRWRSKEPARS